MKKKFLLLFAGMVSLYFSETASACPPPPPSLAQHDLLTRVLGSEAFGDALEAQRKSDVWVSISNLSFYKGGLNVNLTNGCVIRGTTVYNAPTENGRCATFQGVEIETFCSTSSPS